MVPNGDVPGKSFPKIRQYGECDLCDQRGTTYLLHNLEACLRGKWGFDDVYILPGVGTDAARVATTTCVRFATGLFADQPG